METLRAIVTRRRTQRFAASDSLSEETVADLLIAAVSAPSKDGVKPWCFVVVHESKTIRNLAILLKAPDTLQTSATAIAVCANSAKQDQMGHWVLDCAAATENIILAAHDQGLGSCWERVFPSKGRMKMIGDLFKTPQHVMPFSVVFLGESERALNKRASSLPAKQIHLEKW